jgi:CHAT domain-containing protein
VIGAANGGDIREIPLNSMGYDYRAVRFLGIEKPLVFSASATTFVRLASTPRSTAERDFLGFGAYKPPADPAAIAARVAQDEACRKEYKDVYSAAFLSNSLPEVLEVRNTVGGDAHLAIGDDFSEKWMRANKDLLAAYKVLFFSTHGKMPARTTRNCISDPFMTTTVDVDADLTLSARNDLVADGLLQAVEIGGLVLNADLVVLSACETAGGTGEGGGRSDLSISALANMFFVAQARALISAQFSVPDETTRLLMIRLFERRKAGDNLSTALQQAQRSIWSGEVGCTERDTDRCILQGHPFFWSGFMLIGATGG